AAACFGAPVPVAPQTGEQKPPPASEKKPEVKPQKPDAPTAPRRESPKPGPGEERPRSDVPVSFPVDI
ncbi:MAG: hypothetical protein ACREUP_08205, partial [Burkholderiales bacterium]